LIAVSRRGYPVFKSRWSIVSAVVGLVVLVVVVGYLLLVIRAMRERDNLANCAARLHQIGLAIVLYQNDNNQAYPQTIYGRGKDPTPTWGTPYRNNASLGPLAHPDASPFAGPAMADANDITASLFLLQRQEKLEPAIFVCPSTDAEPWDFGGSPNTAQSWSNWTPDGLQKHLSYSYVNNFVSDAGLGRGFDRTLRDAAFAVMSDMNPGGTGVLAVTQSTDPLTMQGANSQNHRGRGQNVLFGDNHAAWRVNPFCGVEGDNIFTAGGPEVKGSNSGRGTASLYGSPVSSSDSVLLPTAADLLSGPPPRPASKP
jgi:hypothetical protein